jgi:Uma2 family endonuclease
MAVLNAEIHAYRLDADRYELIVAAGALEGERVELLDGVIADMSPQSPHHMFLIERLTALLATPGLRLRVQGGLRVNERSIPEPDLALVDGIADPDHHPRTALLVVEVAVTSHRVDRGIKSRLYASAGVPEYWIIDVPARAVEVRTLPAGDLYQSVELLRNGEELAPGLDAIPPLAVADLFEGLPPKT